MQISIRCKFHPSSLAEFQESILRYLQQGWFLKGSIRVLQNASGNYMYEQVLDQWAFQTGTF